MKITWIALLAVLFSSVAQAEMLTFDYVGKPLTYSFDPSHQFGIGPNMTGVLTVDSSVVSPGFTGTLTGGFSYSLGGQSFTPISTPCSSFTCSSQRSVTFTNGAITGWFLGVGDNFQRVELLTVGNCQLLGYCDSFQPFSALSSFAPGKSFAAGTWTLRTAETSPVPLPAPLALLVAGMCALRGVFRRRWNFAQAV